MKNKAEKYDWQALIIITIIMLVCIVMLCMAWKNRSFTINNAYEYIQEIGIGIIAMLFLIGVGIYSWILWIANILIKPKKEILYLKRIQKRVYIFLDSKGNKFKYATSNNEQFEIGIYYATLKTKNHIKDVLEVSYETFPIHKEKVSFWLNWYNPIINLEDMLLLPILYILFIPAFMAFFILDGIVKWGSLIFIIGLGYLIIYDIVYKIKRGRIVDKIESNPMPESQNKGYNDIETNPELIEMEEKGKNRIQMYPAVAKLIFGIVFTIACIMIFFKVPAGIDKIFASPFIICGFALLMNGIVDVFSRIKGTTDQKEKYKILATFFMKLYIIVFLIFWFAILAVASYFISIKGEPKMQLYLIPFAIFGIIAFIKYFTKKTK